MANSIPCDLCGEEPAVLMQSNLANGDAQSVGQSCLLTFALAQAAVFSEGITPEIAVEYREPLTKLIGNMAPHLLEALAPEKLARRRRAASGGASDVSRETSAAGDPDSDFSAADEPGLPEPNFYPSDQPGGPTEAQAALSGLTARLTASGHSGMDDE